MITVDRAAKAWNVNMVDMKRLFFHFGEEEK